MKILIKVASSPTLLEDISQLDPLLATEGWQTLMTFARESAREWLSNGSMVNSNIVQLETPTVRRRWTKISLRMYWIKSRPNRQHLEVAELRASALIARTKIIMAAMIVKSAGCLYSE